VSRERRAGELLHEERENEQLIARAKTELGSAAFAAQYQQQPFPEEGAMVKAWWLRRYHLPPASERCVQSWDTAIKSGVKNDASVCLTFVEYEGNCYLRDVMVCRLEYPDLKRMVYTMAEQWKPAA